MDADGVRPEDGAAVECGPAGVGWFVGARGRTVPPLRAADASLDRIPFLVGRVSKPGGQPARGAPKPVADGNHRLGATARMWRSRRWKQIARAGYVRSAIAAPGLVRGRPAPARETWIAVMAVVLGTSPARPAVTTNADGDPDVTGQVDLGNRIAV
ncbi:hypothetical protein [Kitasatospora purpeofusca]|uniref:hypothetical protein n=1 Tax=Kitasatospora purpeofusca TaxID=67352 RepID=UPI00225BD0D5|nr:hypothetical protein [Kitasatospora purpeofusca]MCX4755407.1 hypothetical protein [Kitasatospora purpeofusca]WSR36721.1 hypothetical protein OG715_40600 [Kitasatospora purpeofusca]WSR45003.1 hypothetical protein OG196_41470 [Kitasatospora purpeofusca]